VAEGVREGVSKPVVFGWESNSQMVVTEAVGVNVFVEVDVAVKVDVKVTVGVFGDVGDGVDVAYLSG